MVTARAARTEARAIIAEATVMEARAIIVVAITITMDSITGRATRTMVQIMGAIQMIIMVLAAAEQGISVVTSGAQTRFVNVWEEICAVAFKITGSCMGRDYDGTCSNTYST